MAKTKSLGTKVDPAFRQEIERLKEAFGFTSFGEMLQVSVKLLQAIDEGVCRIERHPREWSRPDVIEYLSIGREAAEDPEILALVERRLRERFGQDGIERMQEILRNGQPEQVIKRE
jgi:hypothetical protein